MNRYAFKPASHIPAKINAQAVGERLEALRLKNGGRLIVEEVVDDARDPEAPQHGAFEWDDAIAAEAYRVEQGRHLIRSITVTVETRGEPVTTRAFVCVQQCDDDEHTYSSIEAVLQDASLRAQALRRAMRELRAWQQKYREYEELSGVFTAIDSIAEVAA